MNMRSVLLALGGTGFSALVLATFLNTGIRTEHSGEIIRFGVLPINQPEAMAERTIDKVHGKGFYALTD